MHFIQGVVIFVLSYVLVADATAATHGYQSPGGYGTNNQYTASGYHPGCPKLYWKFSGGQCCAPLYPWLLNGRCVKTPNGRAEAVMGQLDDDIIAHEARQTGSCASTSVQGLQCTQWNGTTAVTGCFSLTTDDASSCVTGTSVAIPAQAHVTCCAITGGCDSVLTGTVIGTAGSYSNGNTIANAVDGDITTYFDGPNNGSWVGINFGSPVTPNLLYFAPRAGWEYRSTYLQVQVSNYPDFSQNYLVATWSGGAPATGFNWIELNLAGQFQYLRIVNVPYGNIAEFVVQGCPQNWNCNQLLTGTLLGTSGSYSSSGSPATPNTFSKAHDGDVTTFYDAAAQYGSWVGWDLGSVYTINQLVFTPRSGFTSRMNTAEVHVSQSPVFSQYFVVGQIDDPNMYGSAPYSLNLVTGVGSGAFRYVRIFNATNGNIAEFDFYGCPAVACNDFVQPSLIPSGSTGRCLIQYNSYQSSPVTGRCLDGNLVQIGSGPFAAGPIQVTYVRGAIQYNHGGVWNVNGWQGVAGWVIQNLSGTFSVNAPGVFSNLGGNFADAATCQNANAGQNVTFVLPSAQNLYLKLVDSSYSDNYCSSNYGPPIFNVYQLE